MSARGTSFLWAFALAGCTRAAPVPSVAPTPSPPPRVVIVAPAPDSARTRSLRLGLERAVAEASELRFTWLDPGLAADHFEPMLLELDPAAVVMAAPGIGVPLEPERVVWVGQEGGLVSARSLGPAVASVRDLVAGVEQVGLLFVGGQTAESARFRCLASEDSLDVGSHEWVRTQDELRRAVRRARRGNQAIGIWMDPLAPQLGWDPATVLQSVEQAGLPVFGLNRAALEAGAMVGPVEDPYRLGLLAGRMAVRRAAGDAIVPGELALRKAINPPAARRFGLQLGASVLSRYDLRIGEARPGAWAEDG